MDLGETPVGVGDDDGRDDLGDDEGTEEGSGRTLHEEEAMRTGEEDQCLQDNGNLEVDDHGKLVVVDVLAAACLSVRERDTELVLKKGSLDDDNDKGDAVVSN